MTNPFYQQADKAILLWLIGAEHLGIYVVALSASTAIGSLTNAAGTITFTLAAQANHSEGFDPVFKVYRISMLLWMFFGGLLALSMPWILPLVYGRDFSCAIIPAQLLMAGSAAWGLSLQLEQAMRGQGRAFIGLEGRLVGLIVMAGLGIVLSKYFSLEGICVAFVIGQFFCLAVIIRRALLHYQLLWHISYFFPAKTDLITVFDALQRLLPVKRANL
jgi:O-antigen/teichoic acid export membrane protein